VCSTIGVVFAGCVIGVVVASRCKPLSTIADARTNTVPRDDRADTGGISGPEHADIDVDQTGDIDSLEPGMPASDGAPIDASYVEQAPPDDPDDGALHDAGPEAQSEQDQTELREGDPALNDPGAASLSDNQDKPGERRNAAARKPGTKKPGVVTLTAADVFQVNSNWTGRVTSNFIGDSDTSTDDMLMTITENDRKTIKFLYGKITDANRNQVNGLLQGKKIKSTTSAEKDALRGKVPSMRFTATLKDATTLDVEYSGINMAGRRVWARGQLKLQTP
jgi:hypothetical protein